MKFSGKSIASESSRSSSIGLIRFSKPLFNSLGVIAVPGEEDKARSLILHGKNVARK